MKTIRWGIAGPGNIANKFAKAALNAEGAVLAAVASRSLERGRSFADAYGIETVYGSYEELAASDLVDAVYVSTPHPFHKACAEIFLNAGKHVLCEKPLCVNAAQARQLQACAQRNGVFLMEAMWTRFLPAIREAQAVVARGEIGDILGLEADFCYGYDENDPKIYQNTMAGGALLDVGVYAQHFASVFLGDDPLSITAVSRVQDGVDRHTQVVMRYENGTIANLTSATDVPKPTTGFVYGSQGYLEFPSFFDAQEFFLHTGDTVKHVQLPSLGDGFEEEILEVCCCIREGRTESQILPLHKTVKMLEQMDEIRRQVGVSYPLDGE